MTRAARRRDGFRLTAEPAGDGLYHIAGRDPTSLELEDGPRTVQLELLLADPIVVRESDGRRLLQLRIG